MWLQPLHVGIIRQEKQRPPGAKTNINNEDKQFSEQAGGGCAAQKGHSASVWVYKPQDVQAFEVWKAEEP